MMRAGKDYIIKSNGRARGRDGNAANARPSNKLLAKKKPALKKPSARG